MKPKDNRKGNDTTQLLLAGWSIWQTQAAIQTRYGAVSYGTIKKCQKKVAKMTPIANPKIPSWVHGTADDYTEEGSRLHEEQKRAWSGADKRGKAVRLPTIQKRNTLELSAEMIADELGGGKTAREREYLIVIGELYLEIRALKKKFTKNP